MVRPSKLEWATANNYTDGTPTKIPPSAGQEADGYCTELLIAPQIWNYQRWAALLKAREAESIRVLNFFQADTWAAGGGINQGRGDGLWDPITDTHIYTSLTGAGGNLEWNSVGGFNFVAGVAAPGVVGGAPRIAHDNAGNFGQTMNVAAGLGVYHSVGLGAWAIPAPWNVAMQWAHIYHDHIGLWVVGDDATNIINVSTGPAVALAAPAVPPGWAGPFGFRAIRHSHHAAGMLAPDDTGNPIWIAFTSTQYSTSVDGQNWTAAAAITATTPPMRVAYSAVEERWVSVNHAGWAEYTDNNGSSWTLVNYPQTLSPGVTQVDISGDGYGEFVVVETDGTNVLILASYDNAETWHVVYLFSTPTVINVATWYGGGRFIVLVDDGNAVGPANYEVFLSLRGGTP